MDKGIEAEDGGARLRSETGATIVDPLA